MTSENLPAGVVAPSPGAIAKASLQPGAGVLGLVPQTLDDVYRLSKALAASGEMVPINFQSKPDAIMAAILRGMDVGLRPMQALSSIAVINGRACFWGDALPAIMQNHRHQLDHVIDGEGDDMVAIATLIRGDTGQKIVRTFSVEDAKRAGLWQSEAKVTRRSKDGGSYIKENDSPWYKHPKRMLAMRARSYVCRDGAADAMMGMAVAEEEIDNQPMRDVTPAEPKQDAFAQIAAKARAQAAPADTGPAKEAQPDEGQSVEADQSIAHWADGYDPMNGIPGSKEWSWGMECAADPSHEPRACPFEQGTQEADDWLGGFHGKRKAIQE